MPPAVPTILFVRKGQLHLWQALADIMFKHRAEQFGGRRGWPITKTPEGWEVDRYDGLDVHPVYALLVSHGGALLASCRLLPMTGRTMVMDEFPHLVPVGVDLVAPGVWELTRLCAAPDAPAGTVVQLMAGARDRRAELGIRTIVGVIEGTALRAYRRAGMGPEIIGRDGGLMLGLWRFGEEGAGRDA